MWVHLTLRCAQPCVAKDKGMRGYEVGFSVDGKLTKLTTTTTQQYYYSINGELAMKMKIWSYFWITSTQVAQKI